MSDDAIRTRGLRKHYPRGVEAVKGIDLEVPKGAVYAFLGRNGAGKSTTIKMLMGLLEPSDGEIEVLGANPLGKGGDSRRRVGYVAENQKMYDWMTIDETASFCAAFHKEWDWKLFEELKKKFDLDGKRKLKNLSRGMYAHAALIMALAHKPGLLILDDPTLGLDTAARREFVEEIIGVLHDRDCTVFFSTHIISEIELVADHVGILKNGELLHSSTTDALKESVKRVEIVYKEAVPDDMDIPGTVDMNVNGREVSITIENFTPSVLDKIKKQNPARVEVKDMSLEDIFVALTK